MKRRQIASRPEYGINSLILLPKADNWQGPYRHRSGPRPFASSLRVINAEGQFLAGSRFGAYSHFNPVPHQPRAVQQAAGLHRGRLQEWLEKDAADGFNVIRNYYPGPFDEFSNLVIAKLQRQGIFSTYHEGRTLHENLGLRVPENRYTAARRAKAAD